MSGFRSAAASAALGAAFAAVAVGAAGGTELERTTTTEIALIVVAAVVAALALVFGRRRPAYGAVAVVAFALLVAVTAFSMLWSIVPELSWQETSRMLAYFAAFGAAVAAVRLSPHGWTVVLRGIALGGGVVIAYALASRVWPASLAETEIYARIGQPFDYSNAVGVTAALTVPAALWLGARRSGHGVANALAYPLLSVLIVGLFLSYSRSALVAAGLGALLWVAFVPLRLRTLALLLGASAFATPVIVWATSRDSFTEYNVPIEVRESVATEFGLLVLAMLLLSLIAGLIASFGMSVRPRSDTFRLRAGSVAAAAAFAVPILLVVALAASDRGLGGTISHEVDQLTSADASTAGGPQRLATTGSSRGQYWDEATDIFAEQKTTGAGAGTFGTARLQVRDNGRVARHAHGYVVETLADLGLIGLAASALALIAWLVAAARAVGLWPKLLRAPFDAERVGLVALTLVAVVFGLQSALDWTWFVPGPTVMALVAAGWVAGRGPLRAPEAAEAKTEPVPDKPPRAWPRYALAGLVVVTGLVAAWAAWQPQRSDDASDRALRLIGEDKLDDAEKAADDAYDANPLSSKPLLVRASVEDAKGNTQGALDALERAVREHPAEPHVWARLADYQLNGLNQPRDADRTVRAGLKLDPLSRSLQNTFFDVQARLNPPPPPPTAVPAPAASRAPGAATPPGTPAPREAEPAPGG